LLLNRERTVSEDKYLNLYPAITIENMNVVEKRDFIHSHLHRANESTINEFYEKLRQEEILKEKLEKRARKSENDIHTGKVFLRAEAEQRTANLGSK
jgi:septin family protein